MKTAAVAFVTAVMLCTGAAALVCLSAAVTLVRDHRACRRAEQARAREALAVHRRVFGDGPDELERRRTRKANA